MFKYEKVLANSMYTCIHVCCGLASYTIATTRFSTHVRTVRFELTFIQASALVVVHSTYIGQLGWASAVPLILRMRAGLRGVAYA